MLMCCNGLFKPVFFRTLSFSQPYYRRLEYGVCPICGTQKFKDYIRYKDGTEREKRLLGKVAFLTYEKWLKKINTQKYCPQSYQNICYGDFKKTSKLDKNGLPIYLQLKKNFNNQTEVLNIVDTRVYCCG